MIVAFQRPINWWRSPRRPLSQVLGLGITAPASSQTRRRARIYPRLCKNSRSRSRKVTGQAAGAKLASAGIEDATALIKGCGKEPDRTNIATRLGNDAAHLDEWLAIALLTERVRLSPEETNLLGAADVRSVDGLKSR